MEAHPGVLDPRPNEAYPGAIKAGPAAMEDLLESYSIILHCAVEALRGALGLNWVLWRFT
jgi:hypothetical protein